ncbi:hypothetical protein NDA11_007866 [Ustilago hordei]|uniref:Uncharacterized protein n=1 Tax=Ustilago hordei TaxID=120017 RepID=I2G4R3_USTHO|nr:uncharacterized protein UHO2_01302 [Ustilago hordei]KAJ1044607.1 hypothetical protein NDA10_003400 [Ustilago hordei]KAJ1583284.1 hypothetical protein NDA15_002199 [Ustilago hordei]KAJ1586910.1 hypothetical protein NDA11_007866 [Ustilago hordei]KAJ1591701.1 hypothetical protein NDA12_002241 [Ustilago hordei]KAJ1603242.1 hypothetical protein NDA14_004970 [Ustilago hordei]
MDCCKVALLQHIGCMSTCVGPLSFWAESCSLVASHTSPELFDAFERTTYRRLALPRALSPALSTHSNLKDVWRGARSRGSENKGLRDVCLVRENILQEVMAGRGIRSEIL